MKVQQMMFEITTSNMTHNRPLARANNKKEDSFSSVLSKTQEKNSKQENNLVKANKGSKGSKLAPNESKTSKSDLPKTELTKEVKTSEEDLNKSVEGEKPAMEVMEAELIEAIAAILEIKPDELGEILANLQLGLMDLLQIDNLQQLLMQAHHVEEAMDLLLVPEIAWQIKIITDIIEEFSISSLASLPDEIQSDQEIEVDSNEGILSSSINSDKNPQVDVKTSKENEGKVLNGSNEPLNANDVNVNKTSKPDEHGDMLWENKNQAAFKQDPSANNFLENLSQSIGEAFQLQNDQVGNVNQTVFTRHEVIEPQMLLNQIVERIKVATVEEGAQMNIQLKPEHLGKLNMEVITRQGSMTAHFTVENEKVKETIEQHIESLKETLENRGLAIEKLEVTVGQNHQGNEQTNTSSSLNKNISQIINRMMNEDIAVEDLTLRHHHRSKINENEVDFIA